MPRVRLPFQEYTLTDGIASNFRGESTAGKGLVSAINVDPAEKYLALGQVPGSTAVSSGAGEPWRSIHYFEGFDLRSSDLTRRLIGLAGDTLYDVSLASGTLTTLSGVTQSGIATASGGMQEEALKSVQMLNRLHLASPENCPVKVDMSTQVTRWGVKGPGTTEIVLWGMDDTQNVLANSGVTLTAVPYPVPDEPNSDNSLQIDKTTTSSVTGSVYWLFTTALDFGVESFFVYVYIPPGTLNKLADSRAITITINTFAVFIGWTNTYYFDKGELTEGWNLLEMSIDDPDEVGGSGEVNPAAINLIGIAITTANASDTTSGILFDHMFRYEQGAPIPTVSGGSLILDFEDTDGFQTPGNGTLQTDTSLFTEGAASMVFTKTGHLAPRIHAYYSTIFSGVVKDFTQADKYAFDFYLPTGYAMNMATSGVIFQYGSANLAKVNELRIATSELTEGAWNTFVFNPSIPDGYVGGGAPNLATVSGIRWTLELALPTTTGTGWRLDNFRALTASGGALDGSFSYVTTFVSRYDGWANGASALHESNAGPPSTTVTASDEMVRLESIPVSSDPQVIARRIYRDLDGDSIYRLVTTINDNSTTYFLDNTPLASTSSRTPPLAGDTENDNSPPPPFYDIAVWNNSVFGINANNRFRIEISDPNEPESFPITNAIEVDQELTAIIAYNRALLVFASDRTYGIEGTSPGNYTLSLLNPQIGIAARRAYATLKGFATGIQDDGAWQFFQPEDPWNVSAPIQDRWNAIPGAAKKAAFAIGDRVRRRAIFFCQSEVDGPYDQLLVYSYGKKGTGYISGEGSGVDPDDTRVGGWFELELPGSVNPQCAEIVELEDEDPLVYIGGEDGFIYHLNDPDVSTWATAGTGTTAVRSEIETTDMPLGSTYDGRGRPRYLALNVEVPTSTATLECSVITRDDLDGEVLTSGTWYVTFSGTNDSRLVPVPGFLWGQTARIKLVHSGSGDRPIVKAARLYYIPGRGLGGPH